MSETDDEKKRRSDRLFGAVIGLHGVVLFAVGVGLFFFLQGRVPEGGRGAGQVVYILGLLGVTLMGMGWQKYRGAPDPVAKPGDTTNHDGASRSLGDNTSDGGDGSSD